MASMTMRCVALGVLFQDRERKRVSLVCRLQMRRWPRMWLASRSLWHGCCISLIDGMVKVGWLERLCLDVSICRVIFLLIESCDPCTEMRLRFEYSWDTHHASDGIW
jgi:hypothetical protein